MDPFRFDHQGEVGAGDHWLRLVVGGSVVAVSVSSIVAAVRGNDEHLWTGLVIVAFA
jgi:hypothetical protein